MKYTPKEKAKIANYAVQHGSTAAVRHFKTEFPALKRTTVNEWKETMIKMTKWQKDTGICEPIVELETKKLGRPSTLTEELAAKLKLYVYALREAGGTVNLAILIAAATGMLQESDPGSLECNGGPISLKKSWAKYFLSKLDFVKRKATTKSKITVPYFEMLKQQFLLDIKAAVEIEEIPKDLILNWDQTGINYVPVSQWTMEKKGSKRVEVIGLGDKRQITAVFAGTLAGDFLPVQLVYQGKTTKCLPDIDFPETWHITYTPNHWCNSVTTIKYIKSIIVPYIQEKRNDLGLPVSYPALVIFDEFTGQTTDEALGLLQENNILYVIVPPNTTDRLQPLDLSVNKAAKEFLRSQFQAWYASKISSQVKASSSSITPVDLRLSVMKPIGAQWMVKLYHYFKSKPEIITNGFKAAGIISILES